MTRIKICGLTNIEDAQAALRFGADALGFITVPETPRYVSPEKFHEILDGLAPGPFVATVLVTRRVSDVAAYARPSAIQFYDGPLHGAHEGAARVQVLRVKREGDLSELERLPENLSAVLLDTYHDGKLGGIGAPFDWRLAQIAKEKTRLPLILAGGLTPENITDALTQVRPYAVDVSSGIEAEPGRKDHRRLQAFIQAVRDWDAAQEVHPVKSPPAPNSGGDRVATELESGPPRIGG